MEGESINRDRGRERILKKGVEKLTEDRARRRWRKKYDRGVLGLKTGRGREPLTAGGRGAWRDTWLLRRQTKGMGE